MNKEEAIQILKRANPMVRYDLIVLYVDAYFDYLEASENIAKNGNIVLHPRTGAPIENPYMKVKALAMSNLQKLKIVRNVVELWRATSPKS